MEKSAKKDSYAKSRLKYLLLIPPDKRNKYEIQEISDMILSLDVEFLRKERFSSKFEILCSKLYLRTVPAKNVLFEQDEPGDEMYCIMNGKIGIYKSNDLDADGRKKPGSAMNFVAELTPFEIIGELSVMYGKPRTATAIALEETEVIVLEKNVYDNIMKGFNPSFMGTEIEFLRQFQLFSKASDSLLSRLATRATTRRYGSFQLVARQGDRPDYVYFIRSGCVKIYRKIDMKKASDLNFIKDKEILDDPGEYDLVDGRADTKLVAIDELHAGEYFADYAAIHDEQMEYTAITDSPTEFLLLEAKHMFNIDPDIMARIKSTTKEYPEDSEFRKMYIRDKQWTKYKKNLVENILNDKANRKMKQQQFRSYTPIKQVKTPEFYRKDNFAFKKNLPTKVNLPPLYKIYNMVQPHLRSTLTNSDKKSPYDYFLD